jgi:NADH:ubiquinone oxidoreductase subunit D
MRESIKIIQQAVEKIPGGPYENLEARRFKKAKNSEWNAIYYTRNINEPHSCNCSGYPLLAARSIS